MWWQMYTEARDGNCIVFVAGVVIVLYFVAVHRLPRGGRCILRQGIVIVLYLLHRL